MDMGGSRRALFFKTKRFHKMGKIGQNVCRALNRHSLEAPVIVSRMAEPCAENESILQKNFNIFRNHPPICNEK